MALSPQQIEELVSDEGYKGPMAELGWRNRPYDDPERVRPCATGSSKTRASPTWRL